MAKNLLAMLLAEPSPWLKTIAFGDEREHWVHPVNAKREECGEFHHLAVDLRQDPDMIRSYFRMSPQTFSVILDHVSVDIQKQETNYRKAISSEERLALTLRFLSTGMSFHSLAHSYMMGVSTVAQIVAETTVAIWTRLRPIYLKFPTRQSCEEVAQGFFNKCNFPNVIGAIDGKHVRIQSPSKSGSMFFNYKHFFSIVLQGVADSNLKFTSVDVGAYGKESDGGIFARSETKSFIERNKMSLPATVPLPDQSAEVPYLMLGDAAYPLKSYLLTPFSGKLTPQMQVYNYRHSRARRCVECAFGVLSARWRVLKSTIATDVTTAETIVLAAVVLHNAIITLENSNTSEPDIEMWEDRREATEHQEEDNGQRGRPAHYPIWIKNRVVDYFMGPGALPWQGKYL